MKNNTKDGKPLKTEDSLADSSTNVVSLAAFKNKKVVEAIGEPPEMEERDAYDIFMEAMHRNAENRRRMAEERRKNNRTTLRSYRITDK